MITGDLAASRRAQSSTAASKRSAGSTRFTRPISRASVAETRSPRSSSSLARLRGTLR
jgi:hypothetical protein